MELEHGFFAKIARKFVDNQPLSLMFLVMIAVGGIASYLVMPKSYNPEIKLANFSIMFDYAGANRNEVEQYVTKEFEQSLGDLEGIDTVSSISIEGGRAIVNLSFEMGVNPEDAKTRVLAKLNEEQDYLNKLGISEPKFVDNTSDNIPIFTVGFTSDILPINKVRDLVFEIKDDLRKVDNIANLEIYGGEMRNLKIIPDPEKMNFHKVDASTIIGVIQASNLEIPVGRIKNADAYIDVEVSGDLMSVENIENLYVAQGVQIRDIAEVTEARQEREFLIGVQEGYQKKEAVFLTFAKVPNKNITVIVDDAVARLEKEMQKTKYADLDWEIYQNESEVATESTNNLFVNLIESILIVFVILVFFLHLGPALNVAISIPFVLGLTILIGYLWGETMNKISLFALVVALGLLVDAATVVVESVYRHIRADANKKQAILNTINEVGSAMLFSAICNSMGFLVTSLVITGVMGEYVMPLALFVPFAMLSAFIFAITLVPYLCLVLMKDKSEMKEEEKTKHEANNFFDNLARHYQKALGFILKKRSRQIKFVLGVVAILVVSGLLFVFGVKQKNMPDADLRQFSIYVDLPAGTGIEKTYDLTNYLMDIVAQQEGVVNQQIYIATAPIADTSGLARYSSLRINPNQATIKVNLGPKDLRKIECDQVIAQLKDKVESNPKLKVEIETGSYFRILKDSPGPPVEGAFLLKISGPDAAIREKVVSDLEKYTRQIEGVIYVDTTLNDAYRRVIYEVNHKKALQSGISEAQILQSLLTALDSYQISVYHSEDSRNS